MSLNKGSLDQSLVNVRLKGLLMDGAIDLNIYNLIVDDSGDKTITPAELALLDGLLATTAELNHMQNASSEIQAQLDALQSRYEIPLVQFGNPEVGGGASYPITFGGFPSVSMPSADINCETMFHFILDPRCLDTNTLRITCKYRLVVAGATYSVTWDITSIATGENITSELSNILSGDTTHDFPSITAGILGEITFDVTNADITTEGILQVQIRSDASNTNAVYIHSVDVVPIATV